VVAHVHQVLGLVLQVTGLTRPSSGRAKAGFASFVPPLKSNVRAYEPAGPRHAFARVLVDAVKRVFRVKLR